MKVRHIRKQPWTRKGPVHRAQTKRYKARQRVRARRYAEMQEVCLRYMRPVYSAERAE